MGNEEKKIVIIGAGIAGMMAAFKLAQAGFKVVLIESKPRLGGLSATLKLKDCYFDYGPHAFHVQIERAVEAVKDILKDELELKIFNSQVYFMGKYLTHPLKVKDILFGIKPHLAAQSFFDFAKTRLQNRLSKSKNADNSFKDWVINHFGKKLYDIYFGPYTKKVWGRDPEVLASKFASERIPVTSLWQAAVKTIFGDFFSKGRAEHAHSPYGRRFYYPKTGGSGRLISDLYEKLKDLEVEIHLSSHVRDIIIEDKKVKKVICRYPDTEKEITCDYLLSTIPVTKLVEAVRPRVNDNLLESANKLNYRSMVLLFLVINKDRISQNNWVYFASTDILFNRVYEIKNFSLNTAPLGKTGLCLEITCDKGDSIWNSSLEVIYSRCIKELQETKFVDPRDISYYSYDKIEHAYPIYKKGYENNLTKIIEYIDNVDNLITFGRQGLFTYTNMDHSVDMALNVAEHLEHPENFETSIKSKDLFCNYILSY